MKTETVPTKSEVMSLLEMQHECQLADLFGVTKGAVSQWDRDKPIPRGRYLELRYELRPDIFGDEPDQAA